MMGLWELAEVENRYDRNVQFSCKRPSPASLQQRASRDTAGRESCRESCWLDPLRTGRRLGTEIGFDPSSKIIDPSADSVQCPPDSCFWVKSFKFDLQRRVAISVSTILFFRSILNPGASVLSGRCILSAEYEVFLAREPRLRQSTRKLLFALHSKIVEDFGIKAFYSLQFQVAYFDLFEIYSATKDPVQASKIETHSHAARHWRTEIWYIV